MTRQEAVDLVFDLISAVRDFEQRKDRYYREQYEELRERVIDALSPSDCDTPTVHRGTEA